MKIFHYFKIIFLYFTFVRAKTAQFDCSALMGRASPAVQYRTVLSRVCRQCFVPQHCLHTLLRPVLYAGDYVPRNPLGFLRNCPLASLGGWAPPGACSRAKARAGILPESAASCLPVEFERASFARSNSPGTASQCGDVVTGLLRSPPSLRDVFARVCPSHSSKGTPSLTGMLLPRGFVPQPLVSRLHSSSPLPHSPVGYSSSSLRSSLNSLGSIRQRCRAMQYMGLRPIGLASPAVLPLFTAEQQIWMFSRRMKVNWRKLI